MAEHQIDTEEAQKNLLSCAAFLAEDIRSAEGYAAAMKEIVPHYLAKGDVDLAAALADTVDDPFVRDRLLSKAAAKCAEIDDDEYAFQLVEAIEDHGLQLEARENIALRKAAAGEFEKAFETAAELDHPSNALGIIAYYLTVNNREEEARQTLSRIEYPAAKVNALQLIAEHYEKNEQTKKAAAALDAAAAAAEEIDFPEEKIRILQYIAEHYRAGGRRDKAIQTYDRAKIIAEQIDGVHRDNLLAGIALGFLRAGSLELADRTLDLVGDKTQIANTLTGFSQEFWNNGEKEDALETLEEAYAILKSQRDSEIRDSAARFNLWGVIAVQFAKYEKGERAIEIAQENIAENEQMSALSQIAQICVMRDEDELGRQAINAIVEDSHRMFALIGISDAKNNLGEREKAVEFLNEAAALCETVPQLVSRSAAYNEFTTRFHNYGENTKARLLSHENLEIIAQIRDESAQVVTLAQLAEIYEKEHFIPTDDEKTVMLKMLQKAES
ncbi:MAG: hypothetical protein M3R10_08620 [Verrucomicrobiota bacterium]|nr:hypothetical protein [Verrucomicrobiota bacterium]